MLSQKQTQVQLSRKQMYWKYCFMLSPFFGSGGIFSSSPHSRIEDQKQSDGNSQTTKIGKPIHHDKNSDASNVSPSQKGKGEHKGMALKESDTGKRKVVTKRLKFASTIRVCLIPTRAETRIVAQDLYFTQQDFVEMKRDAIIELREMLQNANVTSKQALHMLYQPIM